MRRKITRAFIRRELSKKRKGHETELLALKLSIAHWKENLRAVFGGWHFRLGLSWRQVYPLRRS